MAINAAKWEWVAVITAARCGTFLSTVDANAFPTGEHGYRAGNLAEIGINAGRVMNCQYARERSWNVTEHLLTRYSLIPDFVQLRDKPSIKNISFLCWRSNSYSFCDVWHRKIILNGRLFHVLFEFEIFFFFFFYSKEA